MYASLGCGAPGAKCTAGPNVLGYFLPSFGGTLDPAETPFAKTPFSRFPREAVHFSGSQMGH